jgi:hypothetical protein
VSGPDETQPSGQVLFEIIPMGAQVRVAAIDEATGTEVVVLAPASATPYQMQQLALARLRKKLGGGVAERAPEAAEPQRFVPGKGKLV